MHKRAFKFIPRCVEREYQNLSISMQMNDINNLNYNRYACIYSWCVH